MIKVLHFVSTPSIGSGVMSVIMNYYRHIDRTKIQFDFLCFIPCEDSYEKEINELGGHIFFVPKPSRISAIKEVFRFFREHQGEYKWLHNHEVYLSFLLNPLAKYYFKSSFIIHSHATKYSDCMVGAIRNAILCFPIRFMKCERLTCSKAAGRFLYGQRMMSKGKVIVLNNAIDPRKYMFDLEKRECLRTHFFLDPNAVVLGHVGRFNYQKNHEYLIRVFVEYQKYNPHSYLICIGEGPLKNVVEKLSKDYQIENKILFLGERKNVHELLNMMDIFMLPSIFEGFPVALVEARCNGLPCIVSDTIADEISQEGIIRLSIKESPELWAKRLLDVSLERKNFSFSSVAYDIRYQAKKLEKIYGLDYE